MKTLLFFLFIPAVLLFTGTAKPIDKEHCSCDKIPLYGKVKVVDSFEDFKVKVVTSFEDLNVEIVTSSPKRCGEWEFVNSFEDFKVKFVDSHEDFTIKYVNSFPGVRQ